MKPTLYKRLVEDIDSFMARDPAARSLLQKQFAAGGVRKTYFVVVRGELREPRKFREPLDGQNAISFACPCFSFALPLPHPRGGDRRFTVLEVEIETGRFHQIRRHFALAGYPLMGDTRHGDRKLNREFARVTGCEGLFLRCMAIAFRCPDTGSAVSHRTRWSREWHRLFELVGTCALAIPVAVFSSRARTLRPSSPSRADFRVDAVDDFSR